MSSQFSLPLEEAPESIKEVFRAVQTLEETDNLRHGDHLGVYNESGLEGSQRWAGLGIYDSRKGNLHTEYFVCYDSEEQTIGLMKKDERRDPHIGSIKRISEEQYEKAAESFHLMTSD